MERWASWLDGREPTPYLVSEWLIDLEREGLAPASRNLYLSGVRSYANYTEADWAKHARPVKVPVKVPDPYKIEDVVRLAKHLTRGSEAIGKWRLRFILLMMVSTGLRSAELLELRLSDMDYSTWQIRVRGKGERERLVAVPAPMREEWVWYVDRVRPKFPDGDLLIVSHTGRPYESSSLRRAMLNLVPGMHPHRLRKTCATALHDAGRDIDQVARVLGHSNIATTRRYLGESDEARHQVMEAITW